tara:strand:- start:608 stop:1072 length:465 start_codon:yes stop_codon:yes gene_type:complete
MNASILKKNQPSIINKKAKYNYKIEKIYDAGIVLHGPEIKSIRLGKISIENAYANEKNNDIWMQNAFIEYFMNNSLVNQSTRPRKLLLKRKEIDQIKKEILISGCTLIPLKVFFNSNGFAKIKLGLSKGRKVEDKREYKKQQDWKRQKARILKK